MCRPMQALEEPRRLWLSVESSSIARLGLLGWMQTTYQRPDQMNRSTECGMWLGCLLEKTSRTPWLQQSAKPFGMGDRRAIDAYAAAVARHMLGEDGHGPSGWPETSRAYEWPYQEIESTMERGARHSEVMLRMLVGILGNFNSEREFEPSDSTVGDCAPTETPLMQDEHDLALDPLLRRFQIRDKAFLNGN